MDEKYSLPDTYYPIRPGCKVRLYQDAQCPTGAPALQESGCFADIHNDLCNARKVICIAGWALQPESEGTVELRSETTSPISDNSFG